MVSGARRAPTTGARTLNAAALQTPLPSQLPAPPQAALEVVQACTRPEVDAEALAALLGRDPVLGAELLRIANSAYFGLASRVDSLARAVTVLGQESLRNLVLCIAVRHALRPQQLPGLDLDDFWSQALRRAVAARALGLRAGEDGEACFTAGLLQDFGLLVLFLGHPQRISEWPRLARALPDLRLELERQLFAHTHEEVGMQLARDWGLPEALAQTLGHHHGGPGDDGPTQAPALSAIAEGADWLAAALCAEERHLALRGAAGLLQRRLGLPAEAAPALFEEVAGSLSAAAAALRLPAGEPPRTEAILREANLELAAANLDLQELSWRLRQAVEERDRIAAELRRELELAREVQRSLLPEVTQEQAGIYGVNVSAREVSGDFFDYLRLPQGRLIFCVADVSGKGMNAALLMAKSAGLFRCLGKGIQDPGRLLAMLNREILETSVRGMFVTMVVGVWDPASGEVILANAGHLPVVQLRDGVVRRQVHASAPPLGVVADCRFPCERLQLGSDCLYLFTDGLEEARDASGRRLQRDGVLRLLERHAGAPPVERLQRIVAAVQGPEGALEDDLTLLVVEGDRED